MSTGWLLTNPTVGLKKPVAPRTVPSDYFDRREFQRILNATYEYNYCSRGCHERAARLRTLKPRIRQRECCRHQHLTPIRDEAKFDKNIFNHFYNWTNIVVNSSNASERSLRIAFGKLGKSRL